MIFIVHPDRSVTSMLESINVGDTATDIVVISPFSGIQSCSLKYLLPNGAQATPQFLAFQGEGQAMGYGYDGTIYTMKIPVAMTRIIGTVQVSFVFTDAQARSFASDTASFTVGGIESLPFPDGEEQGEDFAAQLQAQKIHVDNAAARAEQINDRAEAAVKSFEEMTAEAEMIDHDEDPQVTFSMDEGEDGEKNASFKFKIPRGPTGYSPEFSVIDGKLCVKNAPDAEFEPLDIDVEYNTDKISAGEDCAALTEGSIAFGKQSTAGARGFGVSSFDPTNRQIKIALKSPATGVYASPAYASGDYFSILNGSHYAFCGKIENVSVSGNTATITYTPATEHGTNTSRTDPWWVFDPRTILYSIRAAFWVPAKPLVGYDLKYEGTEAFPNAVAMGGAIAAAMGAFCAGSGCIAGGNYAAIFGTENMGAYGNLMSGRENFSTGLHSALLGRYLKNYGDYNFLACISNEVRKGNFNALFGSTCIQRSGNGSIMGGSGNVLEGTYDAVFGNSHELIGDQNILGGNDVTAGNASAGTKCHYGVIGGRGHKIAQKSTVRDVGVFGQSHEVNHTAVTVGGEGNTTSSDYQTIFGKNAKPDASDLFCLGYNGNRMTLGKNGTRDNVDTDAVTVSFLRKKLETDLLNGSW